MCENLVVCRMLNLCLKDLHIILILIYHASKHFGDMLLCCRTSFERIIQQKNWTWIVAHFPEFNQDLFGLYFSLIVKLNNPPYWKGCVYLVVVGVWFSDTWETKSELVPNDPRWDWVFDVHFFLLKSSFKWSVCYGVVPTTNLHTTSRERDRSVICICTLVTVPTVSLYKSLMKEKIDIRIIRLTF